MPEREAPGIRHDIKTHRARAYAPDEEAARLKLLAEENLLRPDKALMTTWSRSKCSDTLCASGL